MAQRGATGRVNTVPGLMTGCGIALIVLIPIVGRFVFNGDEATKTPLAEEIRKLHEIYKRAAKPRDLLDAEALPTAEGIRRAILEMPVGAGFFKSPGKEAASDWIILDESSSEASGVATGLLPRDKPLVRSPEFSYQGAERVLYLSKGGSIWLITRESGREVGRLSLGIVR